MLNIASIFHIFGLYYTAVISRSLLHWLKIVINTQTKRKSFTWHKQLYSCEQKGYNCKDNLGVVLVD